MSVRTKEKETLSCDVCGVTSESKIVKRTDKFPDVGHYFCSKHIAQLYRHGKIIDATARTTNDRNEYIVHDDYAEMVLRNQTNGIDAIVKIDIEDVEKCKQHKWAVSDRVHGKRQYARGRINGKNIRLHRFLLDYDGDLVVDHINHDTFDCRKQNLRITTPEVNGINKKSAMAYKTENGKWRSYLMRGGVHYYLGTFDTFEEASEKHANFTAAYFDKVVRQSEQMQSRL